MKKQAKPAKANAIGEKEIPVCPKCGAYASAGESLGLGMLGSYAATARFECNKCGFEGMPITVKAKDYAKLQANLKNK